MKPKLLKYFMVYLHVRVRVEAPRPRCVILDTGKVNSDLVGTLPSLYLRNVFENGRLHTNSWVRNLWVILGAMKFVYLLFIRQ